MADGGGQKGIKNSLLSAATGTNFFEEAAMLVPVPIAEPQEPAIAEIDLNSDDSSSNRASIEKELPEQSSATLLGESYNNDPFDDNNDKPPPISLFSRATTGVDAFTRMLAGTSVSKVETGSAGNVSEAPAIAKFTHEPHDSKASVPLVPPPSNMFGIPSVATVAASTNASVFTNLASSTTTTPGPTSVPFAPASSIFSSGSSSAPLFPPVGSTTTPTFPPPSVPSSVFNPGLPPKTTAPFASGPYGSLTSPTPTVPFSNTSLGAGDSMATKSPVMSTIPLSPAPGVVTTANVPPPVAPPSGSNTYRLGAQRMKYVPCPEMQSPPTPASVHPFPLVEPPNLM